MSDPSNPVTPASPRFCDVSLPVPVDRLFTYELPLTLRHRVQIGCRVLVPFGSRRLTGMVLRVHEEAPEQPAREVLQTLDAEPVLDDELLRLGQWIAEYYCAPLGEVLRGMLPLNGEMRKTTLYTLTDAGRDVARQMVSTASDEPAVRILTLLEERPRTAEYLNGKAQRAKETLRALIKRGWVDSEASQQERDPLRASAARAFVEFVSRTAGGVKLKKHERELLAFLELHPGKHNVAELGGRLKKASEAARTLARLEAVRFETETPAPLGDFDRPKPVLNEYQQAASDAIAAALQGGAFKPFLLEGVTGSGKTEVYLRTIEEALQMGKSALLLVPEIGLTPAVAGQFFHRFGKQVAILHSAFSEIERAEQWRRIRNGQARVVVGTRSGVFAPIQDLGLVIVDEEHDASYKQQETPRYHGRDVALVRAKNAGAVVVLGSATPSVESRFNSESGEIYAAADAGAHCPTAHAQSGSGGHAGGVPRNQEAGDLFTQAAGVDGTAPGAARTGDAAVEPPRLFQFHGVPLLRRTAAVRQLFSRINASQARPAHAVPLLRLRRTDSRGMPEMRQ